MSSVMITDQFQHTSIMAQLCTHAQAQHVRVGNV